MKVEATVVIEILECICGTIQALEVEIGVPGDPNKNFDGAEVSNSRRKQAN